MEMAINSSINASIYKASFEVLYGENVPLPVALFSREFSINLYTQNLANKIKKASWLG